MAVSDLRPVATRRSKYITTTMSDSSPPCAPPSIDDFNSVSRGQDHISMRESVEENLDAAHRKVASYQILEATPVQLSHTRQRTLHETAGCYIPPMPVRPFFDEFMPDGKEVPEEWQKVKVRKEKPVRLRELRGTLVALNVVGLPLVAFRKAYELVGALADAMEGMKPYIFGLLFLTIYPVYFQHTKMH